MYTICYGSMWTYSQDLRFQWLSIQDMHFLISHQIKCFFSQTSNWSKNTPIFQELQSRTEQWPCLSYNLCWKTSDRIEPGADLLLTESYQALIELNIEVATFRDLLLSVGSLRCLSSLQISSLQMSSLQTSSLQISSQLQISVILAQTFKNWLLPPY